MMYLKLFGFMAISWSLEFIDHFVDFDGFIVADIMNCLQGFIIFMIFVMQRNVRDLVVKKYNSLRGFTDDAHENVDEEDEDRLQNM